MSILILVETEFPNVRADISWVKARMRAVMVMGK